MIKFIAFSKYKLIFSLVIASFALLTFSSQALAHVLRSDGSIGAIIHIEPEDDPIIGQDATFFFEFKDKENKFNLGSCDCKFQILKGDENIFTESFSGSSTDLESPVFTYVFPEKGVYTLEVTGKPTTDNSFSEFNIKYDLRVERESNETPKNSFPIILFILGIPVVLLIVFGIFKILKGRGDNSKPKGTKSTKTSLLLLLFLLGLFLPLLSILLANPHHAEAGSSSKALGHYQHPCCLPRITDTGTTSLVSIEPLPSKDKVVTAEQFFSEVNIRYESNRSPPFLA